jgi:hypothetical protein
MVEEDKENRHPSYSVNTQSDSVGAIFSVPTIKPQSPTKEKLKSTEIINSII